MSTPTPKLAKIFRGELPEFNKEETAQLQMMASVRTTPRDERFPSTNQALHCWNRYNEWILCQQQTSSSSSGSGSTPAASCKPLRQYAESICPSEWTNGWDEQREEGSFSGLGTRFDHGKGHHGKGHH